MAERWPALPLADWQDTYTTLHMWTQVVGKIALARMPPVNHSWGVALQLTPRGLSTGLAAIFLTAITVRADEEQEATESSATEDLAKRAWRGD